MFIAWWALLLLGKLAAGGVPCCVCIRHRWGIQKLIGMTNDKTRTRMHGLRGLVAGVLVWLLGLVWGRFWKSEGLTESLIKKSYARPYARASGVPLHLLCNPDIIFGILGYLYGIPANPLGTYKGTHPSLLGLFWRKGGVHGCIPGRLNASVQLNFAFVNPFLNFLTFLG